MIVYLDTSAIVPLLVEEATTAACLRLWDDADRMLSCRISYAEVAAALAMAERQRRVTEGEHDSAWSTFEDLWADLDVIEVSADLTRSAAAMARPYALRGYDSVQCAAAQAVQDPDLVAASGDRRLLDAWHALGMATYDTCAEI